jgi:hypothetical protein
MTRQPMPFDVTPFHWLLHLSLRLDDVYWTSGNAVKELLEGRRHLETDHDR